ncbi:MAG: hypothetical protein KDB14_14295 [Planctomycetales bacterium]|nr:hypothetical protein [Planctomycetales bacterium]
MWCRQCQQDVPAVISSRDQRLCCPRCAQEITRHEEQPVFEPDWAVEDWDLDADLRELDSLQRELHPEPAAPREARARTRFDTGAVAATPPSAPTEPPPPALGLRTTMMWCVVLPGISLLFSGAMLTAWSFWGNREELWRVGLPAAVVGQALLMLGVLLYLDISAQQRRHQEATLRQLREQLREPAAAPTLAGLAPPHLLLAEIKSKLDTLQGG